MYAEIVFPMPFNNSFSYSVPEVLKNRIFPGIRALAPFGNRVLTGFVISTFEERPGTEEIKDIIKILDDIPVFTPRTLKFYRWMSEYYICSFGEALKLASPQGTSLETRKRVNADPLRIEEFLKAMPKRDSIKAGIMKSLLLRPDQSLNSLRKEFRGRSIYSAVEELRTLGLISITDELEKPAVSVKTAKYARITSKEKAAQEIPYLEKHSPKALLLALELLGKKEVRIPDLLKKVGASQQSLQSLCDRGIVEIFEKEEERKYSDKLEGEGQQLKPNPDQEKIVRRVSEYSRQSRFKTFLLYGVTGSGKTLVYIELAKAVLAIGKGIIILVPEISLTPQITSRFFAALGDQVAVIHSRLSKGERFDAFRGIASGRYKAVIGARSALFSPVMNLGMIIVDEEHDQSYKQSTGSPKYNARDCAVMLGSLSCCPVLLGSATPSVETMFNAKEGKYQMLELRDRADGAQMPDVRLVDLRKEKAAGRLESSLSKTLIDAAKSRLEKEESVILLQNRRGFATQVYCEDCGEKMLCEYCSVSMVYHMDKNYMQCHYCGRIKNVPNRCPKCGSLSIRFLGAGTQKVEDELQYYLPEARIERIDSDSVSGRGKFSRALNRFKNGDTNVLLGTQMVSKGLDFANVTLVGVVSADAALWMPDFRADERAFQLLTQVSGRSGRSSKKGLVIIQTRDTDQFVLKKVQESDYQGFYQREIGLRKELGYPPFTRLALVEVKDASEERASGAIEDFYKIMSQSEGITANAPTAALISKIMGSYRFHMLIKSRKSVDPRGNLLREALLKAIVLFKRTSRNSSVNFSFDIDPQGLI